MSINKTTKSKLNFLEGKRVLFKQNIFSFGNPMESVLDEDRKKNVFFQENRSFSPGF